MEAKRENLHTFISSNDVRDLDEFIRELKKERTLAKKMDYTNLQVEVRESWDYYDNLSISFILTGRKNPVKLCVCDEPVEPGTTACKKHNTK